MDADPVEQKITGNAAEGVEASNSNYSMLLPEVIPRNGARRWDWIGLHGFGMTPVPGCRTFMQLTWEEPYRTYGVQLIC